jgi:hypothetical protein
MQSTLGRKTYICPSLHISMKPTHYLAGLLLILTVPLSAQVSSSSLINKNRPDTAENNFKDGFVGFGFVLGTSQAGAKVKPGDSREFIVGFGVGHKFCKYDGIGIDIYYKSTSFFLVQDSTKVLPNNTLHNSEKIAFNNAGGLIFNRFYFGTIYIDAGFYYDFAFDTKDVTWDKFSNTNAAGSTTAKTINSPLLFTNNTNYGLTFRLGKVEGISFYFNYRLSKVFDQNYNGVQSPPNAQGQGHITPYPDLPPFVLGLIIGSH